MTVTVASLRFVTVMAPVMVTVLGKVMLFVPSMFWLLVLKVTGPLAPNETVPELLLVNPFRKMIEELFALVQLPPELMVTAPMYVLVPVLVLARVPVTDVVPVTSKE